MSQQTERLHEERLSTNEPMVAIRGLKTYYDDDRLLGGRPVKAVDGVSIDIHRGETLGLVGESGCGKTTLGRTLLRLEEATDGEVRFEGTNIMDLSGQALKEWRRDAQIVFQDPDSSLNDRMTIGEIIREPLDVHEWKTPPERRARVQELLETVGLRPEHYYRYPHQFSGGQRQRISIARTLTLEPEFIVLDEPVSALDVSVQAEVINLLEDLQDQFGLTYLFIAHDLSVVRHICDRVAVMYLGKIMEVGQTEQLFTNPANPYTHALLSAIPRPDPNDRRERIALQGTPPNPRYPPNGCPFKTRCPARIRPEEYDTLDEELWMNIVLLEQVLRERSRMSLSIRERVGLILGRELRGGSINDILDELFGHLDVPSDVSAVLDEVATLAADREEGVAADRLDETFGGICSSEAPGLTQVGNPHRFSRCHRHQQKYATPTEVLGDQGMDRRK